MIFLKSLQDAYHTKKSAWPIGGSFLTFSGKDKGADLAADCQCVNNSFICNDVNKIRPGMTIRIVTGSSKYFIKLHAKLSFNAGKGTKDKTFMDRAVKVVSVNIRKKKVKFDF